MTDSDDGKLSASDARLVSDVYKDLANDERSVARKNGEWVGAALLALHGGAIVALLGVYNKSGVDIVSLTLFGVGILITIVSGIVSNHVSYNNWMRYSSIQNDFLFSGRSSQDSDDEKGIWIRIRSDFSFYMKIISIVVFVVGAAASAYYLRNIDRRTEPICRLVEGDMMRRIPLKADSPAVFQALGCRPQGGGSVYAPPPRKKENTHVVIPSARPN